MGRHQLDGGRSQVHGSLDGLAGRLDHILDALKLGFRKPFVQRLDDRCGSAHHGGAHIGPGRLDAGTGSLCQIGKTAYSAVQLDQARVELAEGDFAVLEGSVQIILGAFSGIAERFG